MLDWQGDVHQAIENLEYLVMNAPTDPGTNAHMTELFLWQEEM
jgi:hypothetical protein